MDNKIYIIAGEKSGDKLGSDLMVNLNLINSDFVFCGVGGPLMQAEGLVSIFPMEELSLMGIFEILPKLPRLFHLRDTVVKKIISSEVSCLITIDSPEFSFSVSRKVKKYVPNLKIIHYVAPSLWAWRPKRGYKIAKFIDHILALFPFEPKIMQEFGISCDFVGHPISSMPTYNENELSYDVLDWYKENIIAFFDKLKYVIQRDNDNNIIPMTAKFSEDAKKEWVRIFNEITSYQNSDDENEYLKSMYPKQKSYIPRFTLLIHAFDENFSAGGNVLEVSKESVLKAEKLSKYFIATAKKIKINAVEVFDIKTTLKGGSTNFEKVKLIFEKDADFNRTQIAELLGVSRQTILRFLKDIDKTTVT